MAAHRYWRVNFIYRDGNRHVHIYTLRMSATAGSADQCTGGTASSSGHVSNPPANAFDGNGATFWQSDQNDAPKWLQYDFGAPVSVDEIALTFGASSSTVPLCAWLLYSDDATTWRLLGPVSAYSTGDVSSTKVTTGFGDVGASANGSHITLSPGWPAQALNAQFRSTVVRTDIEDSGAYRIAGITRKETAPDVFVIYPYRRVRLLERQTGRLIRETWSDPVTGAYAFEKLKLREYILLTDDHARYYNAVAADAIVPVL